MPQLPRQDLFVPMQPQQAPTTSPDVAGAIGGAGISVRVGGGFFFFWINPSPNPNTPTPTQPTPTPPIAVLQDPHIPPASLSRPQGPQGGPLFSPGGGGSFLGGVRPVGGGRFLFLFKKTPPQLRPPPPRT